jgi:hypothetical protein
MQKQQVNMQHFLLENANVCVAGLQITDSRSWFHRPLLAGECAE